MENILHDFEEKVISLMTEDSVKFPRKNLTLSDNKIILQTLKFYALIIDNIKIENIVYTYN